jgi:hypothetical protein
MTHFAKSFSSVSSLVVVVVSMTAPGCTSNLADAVDDASERTSRQALIGGDTHDVSTSGALPARAVGKLVRSHHRWLHGNAARPRARLPARLPEHGPHLPGRPAGRARRQRSGGARRLNSRRRARAAAGSAAAGVASKGAPRARTIDARARCRCICCTALVRADHEVGNRDSEFAHPSREPVSERAACPPRGDTCAHSFAVRGDFFLAHDDAAEQALEGRGSPRAA